MLLKAKRKSEVIDVKIDALDYAWAAKESWFVTDRGYVRSSMGSPRILLHRAIMAPKAGLVVDHINGDKLDNRRCNLRVASHAENMRNRKLSKAGTKGVTWRARDGKWEAAIKVDKKSIFLGSYQDKQDAVSAYDAAANFYHKGFAKVNVAGSEECLSSEDLLRANATPRSSKSGFIGVTKDARANSWRAEVKGHDGSHWRESFASAEDAARARDAMAKKLQGTKAKLNFKDD